MHCAFWRSFSPWILTLLVVVASQCLESAYGITIRDVDACSLYPLPASLQHIFAVGLSQMVCGLRSTTLLFIGAAAD